MSSQRVEGYSFLILFREVDSLQPPAESDRGVHPLKECSRERLRKEEVKKNGRQNPSPSHPPYLLYYTSALLSCASFPYT